MSNFTGFPKESLTFFKTLARNNNKEWFDAHRDDYQQFLIEPARAFVTQMGLRLREISPTVVADPSINQSIFRINRDTRFSKDKTPYKTHLAIGMWDGKLHRRENPFYYFHFDTSEMIVGVGHLNFPKPMLEAYREAVIDPKQGAALEKAMKSVEEKGYEVGGKTLKKTPRGYDADHPRAELLLYNGMHVGETTPLVPELHSAALLDYCYERWHKMSPIFHWMVDLTERAV
jgi:uncharacterized protein (TIGR02453 family)